MFLKLFNFATVFFLVIFSILGGAVLMTGLMSLIRPRGGGGVFAVSGGLSVRQLQFALVGVALVAVALFVLRRWRKD